MRIWNLHHNWTVSLVEGFSLRNWICLCIEPLAHHYTSSVPDLFFIFINLFIYLFLAVLGLRCCVQSFSSCGERGLLFIVVHGLLIVVTSLVAEHGL